MRHFTDALFGSDPESHDQNGIARLYPGRIQNSTGSCLHRTANHAGNIQRDILVDLYRSGLGRHHAVGKSTHADPTINGFPIERSGTYVKGQADSHLKKKKKNGQGFTDLCIAQIYVVHFFLG